MATECIEARSESGEMAWRMQGKLKTTEMLMDQSGLWQTELSCLERDGDMTFDMREVVLTYRSNKSRLMGCLHDELFPD